MTREERATEAPADTDPYVGVVAAGRFEILEPLGRGGMGCVYRARHVVLKRDFALKLLTNRGVASTGRKRFEREAFAAARLEHPNCVAVTDFGNLEDGSLFLAMELVDGEPLSAMLEREARLPPQRALHIMRHILTGLGHAHERGVVHRDLKPANVMLVDHLGDPDFAKVVDFGLAKLIGDAELEAGGGKLTEAGITFGTPRYISPEQAFGKPVDHRSDLYSASVMLFEMLTGKLPFDGTDARQILMMHGTRAVPRMHEVAPGISVPLDVEMLVRQGLAKDPRDRMSNAHEYIAGIDRCVAGLEQARTGRMSTPRPVLLDASEISGTDETRPLPPAAPAAAPPPPPPAPSMPPAPAPSMAPPTQAAPPVAVTHHPLPARRRRRIGPLAGLGVAAAAGAIALAIAGGQSPAPATTEASAPTTSLAKPVDREPPAKTPQPDPPAKAAADPAPAEPASSEADDALASVLAGARGGHDHKTEKALLALRKRYPDDGAVANALGNLYAKWPWPTHAIRAYRDAIHLAPGYRNDSRIIVYLIKQLTSRSAHRAAERLLVDLGEPALPALRDTQAHHHNPRIRSKAGQLVAAIERRSQE